MTLDEAVERIERLLEVVDDLPAVDVVDIYSGGVRKKGGPVPALYAGEELAIEEWYVTVTGAITGEVDKIRWIDTPHLDRYQITMQDRRGTHRVCEDRFTVSSRLVFQ